MVSMRSMTPAPTGACAGFAVAILSFSLGGSASAADISGQVLGAGAPIANSTVTLWAASASNPQELAQARTGADGRFSMAVPGTAGKDASLYTRRPARPARCQQGKRRQFPHRAHDGAG